MHLKNENVIFSYKIKKKRGDYAGLSVSSQASVQSGQSTIFLDDYNPGEKGKKAHPIKRLMVSISPLIIASNQ
jgi:hypothetical protein